MNHRFLYLMPVSCPVVYQAASHLPGQALLPLLHTLLGVYYIIKDICHKALIIYHNLLTWLAWKKFLAMFQEEIKLSAVCFCVWWLTGLIFLQHRWPDLSHMTGRRWKCWQDCFYYKKQRRLMQYITWQCEVIGILCDILPHWKH